MFRKQKLLFVAALAVFGIAVSYGEDNLLQESHRRFQGRLTGTPEFFLEYGAKAVHKPDETPEATSRRPRGPGADIYQDTAPAIVMLVDDGGHGTGFFVSDDGWIVTNHHVVAGSKYVPGKGHVMTVMRGKIDKDGWMASPYEAGLAVVYKVSERQDLALLKLTDLKEKVPFLKVASALPKPGDDCVAIGHPGIGSMWSVRAGQITGNYTTEASSSVVTELLRMNTSEKAEAQKYLAENEARHFQTDLDIHPGDSGGPLLNAAGEVIGVTVAFRADSVTSLSLHVHHSELTDFLREKPKKPLVMPPTAVDMSDLVEFAADVDDDGIIDGVIGKSSEDEDAPIISVAIAVRGTSDAATPNVITVADSESQRFVPAFSMYALPKLTIAFDTDLDSTFDLIFRDEDSDGEIETTFVLTGDTWSAEKFDGDALDADHFSGKDARLDFSKWSESLREIFSEWRERTPPATLDEQ